MEKKRGFAQLLCSAGLGTTEGTARLDFWCLGVVYLESTNGTVVDLLNKRDRGGAQAFSVDLISTAIVSSVLPSLLLPSRKIECLKFILREFL